MFNMIGDGLKFIHLIIILAYPHSDSVPIPAPSPLRGKKSRGMNTAFSFVRKNGTLFLMNSKLDLDLGNFLNLQTSTADFQSKQVLWAPLGDVITV